MTNTTEMPEKIWAEPLEDGKVRGKWTSGQWTDRDNHYTRTDTIPDVAELQRQNAALKAFVKTIIRQSWEHMELSGADIQETAVNHEILNPKAAEENDVCEESDYLVGDDIFVFADWLTNDTAKIPIPSRAEVAREFYREVMERYGKRMEERTGMIVPHTEDDRMATLVRIEIHQVLMEWEDAESK